MDEMIKKQLPSGAELSITIANFANGKNLYQTIMRICGGKFNPVVMISSTEIEDAIWKCMDRVLYNGVKIAKDTFEPVEARQDYVLAMFEVAKENIEPFTKALT